jgi:exonuclease SbcD
MHLSDLHLGKRMGEFSLYEDQRHILMQILSILDQQRPDALLIAGDVYNKSTPSIEAVNLLDWFLVELARRELPVFISSGNHDSPDRLAFAARLMRKNQIYISPVYNSFVQPITLEDEYGPLDIFLLPFLKPAHLRRLLPDQKIETYTDALAGAIRQIKRNPDRRSC